MNNVIGIEELKDGLLKHTVVALSWAYPNFTFVVNPGNKVSAYDNVGMFAAGIKGAMRGSSCGPDKHVVSIVTPRMPASAQVRGVSSSILKVVLKNFAREAGAPSDIRTRMYVELNCAQANLKDTANGLVLDTTCTVIARLTAAPSISQAWWRGVRTTGFLRSIAEHQDLVCKIFGLHEQEFAFIAERINKTLSHVYIADALLYKRAHVIHFRTDGNGWAGVINGGVVEFGHTLPDDIAAKVMALKVSTKDDIVTTVPGTGSTGTLEGKYETPHIIPDVGARVSPCTYVVLNDLEV